MYEERMMRFQKKDSDDFDEENHVTIDEEGIMRDFQKKKKVTFMSKKGQRKYDRDRT